MQWESDSLGAREVVHESYSNHFSIPHNRQFCLNHCILALRDSEFKKTFWREYSPKVGSPSAL